ncbi:MAG: DUF790 family protein [Candidatus Jordarchaeales archaeon]|nr:DUF790 family protein [Candidatus Jordarchaeia archaeon]
MLPSELLVVKVYGNKIFPRFARLSRDNIELASEVIEVFRSSIGRKRDEILEILSEFEQGVNYRFIRGLRILLERRSMFEVKSRLNPAEVRKLVFEEASRVGGVVADRDARRNLLERVASKFSASVEEVEEALWADQEGEQVLSAFSEVEPIELLKMYNLSLAQTLLFNATSMNLYVEGLFRGVLREIKYRGLMYFAEKTDGGVSLTIDGPASLLKLTEKYGTSMAKILPSIVSLDRWTLRANVVRRDMDGRPRVYEFLLTYRDKYLLSAKENVKEKREEFDSSIEEEFYTTFQSLGTGWKIRREPDTLVAGSSVFVPDFVLEKGNVKVYVEIVGFWTENYVKKKLEKLGRLQEKVVLLVNEELACSAFQRHPDVIYYKRRIPLKSLLEVLGRREAEAGTKALGISELKKYKPKEKVVYLSEVAAEYGLSVDVVRKNIEFEGYRILGDMLISETLLKEVEAELERFEGGVRSDVEDALRKYGIRDIDSVLDFLGFKTIWRGVDPRKARVVKLKAT